MEKTNNISNYDSVPYIAYESALMRAERQIRRLCNALIVAIIAIVLVVGCFIWYLYQYDFVSNETVTVDGADGVANYIGKDGTIYNGESSGKASPYSQEEEWTGEGDA